MYGVPYLNHSILNLFMFIQHLANDHSAPSSIRNYFSGACNWVLLHGGNDSAFSSYEISAMFKGDTKNADHAPSGAFPLIPPLMYSHVVQIFSLILLHLFPSLLNLLF